MRIVKIIAYSLWALPIVLGACDSVVAGNNNWSAPDAAPHCVPDDDDDGDGITNFIEGCLEGSSGRNTDGDEWPDWLDPDSDNDGCLDADEDSNGDGEVGDCRTFCPNLDPAECGPGQRCLATGRCDPPATPECAADETDPLISDTNGDGLVDCVSATVICEPQSPDNPLGRPAIQVHTSPDGRLQIAAPPGALIRDQTIVNNGAEDCANGADDDADGAADCDDTDCHTTSHCFGVSVTFDTDIPSHNIPSAGFAFTRRPLAQTVTEEGSLILEELRLHFDPANVAIRTGGASAIVLDQVPSVVEISVDIDVPDSVMVHVLRDRLVAALLHRSTDELINRPGPYGLDFTRLIASFSIQRRTPPTGEPYIAVMGAVTSRDHYDVPDGSVARQMADIANGSGLALPGYGRTGECEERNEMLPANVVDMIWVIDGSFSAQSARTALADAATDIFNEAISYELDFRMAVVDMGIGNEGVFCTGQGQSGDFFLTPANRSQFEACIREPAGSLMTVNFSPYGITQGYDAIVNHLPRANAPNRIRPNASLYLIYFTDEAAKEVETSCGWSPPWDPACIQTVIQPTVNLLLGVSNPDGQGTAHAIVGPPPSGCSTADLGGGYVEIATATGGQIASICETDYRSILSIILQTIYATAYFQLNHRPISATITVARDGLVLERSRSAGFYYEVVGNTILFAPYVFEQDVTADLVIGYERWASP